MSNPKIPLQSELFYDSYWTEYVDLCFVTKLESEATRLGFPLSTRSTLSITRARNEIYRVLYKSFSEAYCMKRFCKLQDRYNTFKDIINSSEFYYDETNNIVHADQSTWDDMCMSKELGVAYRFQGDPCWEYLKKIFGEAEDCQLVPEYVNVSSDNSRSRPNKRMCSRNVVTIASSSTSQSTNSYYRIESDSSTGGDENDNIRSSQASSSWANAMDEN